MAHADFVHLRVHSAYSLSEGAIKVKALAKLCERHAMPAVAVTDKGNLFGALEISGVLWEAGVQPIVGCLLQIARDDVEARGASQAATDEILLLVQNEAGYRNLSRLVSLAYLDAESANGPRVLLDALERHADGLIALIGSPQSAIGRLLGEGRAPKTEDALEMYKRMFDGRLYVEIMRHDLPEEAAIEDALVDLAYRHELPLVATNDVYFADEAMYEAHDALLCIADGAYVNQPDRRRLTPDHRFKSARRCAPSSPTCPRPSTTPWRSPGAAPTARSRSRQSCRRTPRRPAATRPRSCAPRQKRAWRSAWRATSTARR